MLVREKDVFKDKKLAYQLLLDGVVKIPFLTTEEVDSINLFYDDMHNNADPPTMYDGIHMTIWNSDLNYKLKIKNRIKSIVTPAFERNFENYRTLTEQFIVKKPGLETTFHIHQDWSIVDENKFFSLNFWIPLHDVDENNGAMWIVKGSHNINQKIRGAGVIYPDYRPLLEDLKPLATSYDMKAGEALIFYHSTLHGSPFNKSNSVRKVVQVALLHRDTPLQIYFQKDSLSPLEIHKPEDDFSYNYNEIRIESTLRPPTPNPQEVFTDYHYNNLQKSEIIECINKRLTQVDIGSLYH